MSLLRSATALRAAARPVFGQQAQRIAAPAVVAGSLFRTSKPARESGIGKGQGYDMRRQALGYSDPGCWSVYAWRQRYPILVMGAYDPLAADWFAANAIRGWHSDVNIYALQWVSVMAATLVFAHLVRYAIFNPDIKVRRSSVRKLHADLEHYWAYGLPFYNHRLRNVSANWAGCLSDNDPQWNQESGSGIRPDRADPERRFLCYSFISSHMFRYTEHNWMHNDCSYQNMCKMLHDIGYKKMPHMFHEEDDDH